MATKPNALPISVNFVCYRGDDWTRMFEPIAFPAGGGAGAAIDMTGWTGRMQIRAEADAAILLEASSANGRIITGPQSGSDRTWQLLVYLSDGDTSSLPAGFVGRYDIELTKTDGKANTWYAGAFCVEGDITR